MDRYIIGPKPRTVISYFLETSATAETAAAAEGRPHEIVNDAHTRVEEREVPPLAPRIAIDIFCDGACINNGRRGARAAYGMMARRGASELFVAAEPLRADEPQTNQRAELRGLAAAVSYALTAVSAGATTIRIYSDSEYSINCVTKWVGAWRRAGWKKADGTPVLHRDILEPLCDKWDSLRGVAFLTHVAAHTGRRDPISLGNERADELARAALASTHGFF